jgi:hypothetical protein
MKIIADNKILSILFIMFIINGCKKYEVSEEPTSIDTYTLEIDGNYLIYKVSFN